MRIFETRRVSFFKWNEGARHSAPRYGCGDASDIQLRAIGHQEHAAAAAKGAKKTRMIYNVMSEIGGGLRPRMVPILFGDNAAAVQVNNNMGALGSRVRHLELSHFMTRDMVMSCMLIYLWCESAKMRADMFAKNLGRILFCRLLTAVCGYNCEEEGSAVDDTVDSAEGASVSRDSDSEAGREGAEGTD